MLASDKAASLAETRHDDFIRRQVIQADSGRHNIHDGIDSADFVEVDLIDRKVVCFRFCFRNEHENLLCDFTGMIRHGSAVNDRHDIRQIAVFMMVVMAMNVVMIMMMALFAMEMRAVMFFIMVMMMVSFLAMEVRAMVFFLIMMVVMMMFFTVFMAVAMVLPFLVMMVMMFFRDIGRNDRIRAVEVCHVMVVVFMFCIEDDIEVATVDAGFLYAGDFCLEALHRKGSECCFQCFPVSAQIKHGSNEHISADAGTGFQI